MGRFGRFRSYGSSFSYTFNNDTWKELKKKFFGGKDEEETEGEEKETDDSETGRYGTRGGGPAEESGASRGG